jgi:hypothetical protein
MMNEVQREVLRQRRRVYPHGVPENDFMPLLAVLADGMNEENVAIVVADLIDREVVVVANDVAARHRAPTQAQ